MIVPSMSGFRAELFNGYLDSKRNEYLRNSSHSNWKETYICPSEPLPEEEKSLYPNCRCVCFRIVGYTIGHLIIDSDRIIKNIYVYNRDDVNDFEMSCSELQNDLRTKFVNKKLE